MTTQHSQRKLQWLSILLIIWNLFDIGVHVTADMVEPLRITGNVVGIFAALSALLGVAKSAQPFLLGSAAVAVVVLNVVFAAQSGARPPMLVFIGVSLLLLLRLAQRKFSALNAADGRFIDSSWAVPVATLVGVALVLGAGILWGVNIVGQTFDGALEAADYWSDEPAILSAGMGFDNIIGLPELTEDVVREAGGNWYASMNCLNGDVPEDGDRTSAVLVSSISSIAEGSSDYDDGLPIVFSWPIATETIDVTDFQFTLNTGEIVFPNAVTMTPNWELNERNVVVAFGDFGNRGLSSEADVIFPVKLEIVADESPLLLVGPGGQEVNAVGLTWTTDTTPYDFGPTLVGAKLNFVGDAPLGEGGSTLLENSLGLPNDEFALYDEGDFRIRVLTTGGFSPDGFTGLRPDMYADFFRVHVTGAEGETVLLENVGEEYTVAGGTLRVVGLAELGQKENPDDGIYYDDCYTEDRDNYIDIILVGDEAAARNITFVEIPALDDGYRAFYNPGGPGPEPFEGVRYTAPGPPDMEPVINALDNPMRMDRDAP